MFRSMAERKVRAAGIRPGAAAARPVPDQEVAGPPRGPGAEGRPRDVELPRVRRGRGGARAHLGAVQRAAARELDAGHPLRHALEPLRRAVRGRPLARAREALPAEPRARASRSPTPSTASPRTRRSSPRGRRRAARHARRRRAADAATTAGRCASSSPASTSGRAPSGCAAIELSAADRRASGSATATTTTPTPGRKSAIRSSGAASLA